MLLTRRSVIQGSLTGAAGLLRPVAGFGQDSPGIVIAVNAGSPAKAWRDVVAGPYTAATGVPVEIFEPPGAAAMVAQSGGHPTFNLAMVPFYAVPRLVAGGLVEEMTPDDIPGVRAVPEQFWLRTPNGKLAGVPLFFSLYGIAYNTDFSKASDFDSWLNLLQPQWKGRISVTRPFFLAVYDLNVFAKLGGGDEHNVEPGYKLIGQLAANALNVYTSMTSLQAQLVRGDVTAAPFYSSEVISMKREGVTNVEFVIPREGAMIIPQVLIMPKGARNQDAAKMLMSRIVEPKYEVGFAQAQWNWPMNTAIQLPSDLVAAMGGTSEQVMARSYNPDWAYIGTHLEERLRRIEQILNALK